ncbi:hypothetical protein HY485_03010 [Candidatus Woesearchaeota archaeon]|nr:hypothetical protein [Candidatus Woesearchaeota archaeon]
MTAQESLVERLMNPRDKNTDPHEIARELTWLSACKNSEGIRKLRDAYLIGAGRILCSASLDTIQALTNTNLLYAAGIADIVAKDGYEASGQLHAKPQKNGPVAKFFKEATGYKV